MRGRSSFDDEGTVLLLILGLVTVAALLVAVVADVSALYLERRKLVAAVDGAALAGAQAVNEAAIYREGLPTSGPVPLDRMRAEEAAREYLRVSGVALAEVSVVATRTEVTVTVRGRYRLPVASTVTADSTGQVSVSASATARTAVIP